MNDTLLVGDPSLQVGQEGHVAGDTGSVVNPGVDVGATRTVSSLAAPSRRALAAHRTQAGPDMFFMKIPPELFAEFFGRENFQRVSGPGSGSGSAEVDLFAGL